MKTSEAKHSFSSVPVSALTLDSPHSSTVSLLKRLLDIIGSLVGLVILTIVYFPIVIAIKLESPGPIFFTQVRCGLRGKPFRLIKFRSMVVNADELKHLIPNEANGLIFKNKSDPRVTKTGRFLRKTSLDELPQFWNVLMGDMSLVGTRPPTLDEVAHYKGRHWRRLNVKPGMTGEWQVRGRSTVQNFEQIIDLDLQYQERWSIPYDLFLILKTIQVVFTRTGAY